MASEDFIGLDSENGSEAPELDTDNLSLEPTEGHPNEDHSNSSTFEKVELNNGSDVECLPHVVHDDLLHPSSVFQESINFMESATVVEGMGIVEPGHMENGCMDSCLISKHMKEEGSVIGVKRSRMTGDEQPSVHVLFKSLSRASRKKLEDLLQQWSEWHGQHVTSSDPSTRETLEDGEETYFPALYVGLEKKPAAVSFCVDKRARKDESEYVDSDLVPLYDRGYVLGSTSGDGSVGSERSGPLEAARCFNCGSYSHSLRDCQKPRDNVAINIARKEHGAKRNSAPGSRSSARYYQNSAGKYDDLKAGVLGPELRKCLGIGELDPPPWLHRMRELGYPPGYIEEDQDQVSGITIYADEEAKAEYEEGELPEKGEPEPREKKTVEFPGINAPIPERADRKRWAAVSPSRSKHGDERRSWDHGGDCPPGSSYGFSYSPSCSPYDQISIPPSPDLRRSLSERRLGFLSQERSPGDGRRDSSPYHNSQFPADRYRAFEGRTFDGDDSHRRDSRYYHRDHRRW